MFLHHLPHDLQRHILLLILSDRQRVRCARHAQRARRGYRIRVLVGRFRMLRYLHSFREWNPTIELFWDARL